jgi:hypothetical protein
MALRQPGMRLVEWRWAVPAAQRGPRGTREEGGNRPRVGVAGITLVAWWPLARRSLDGLRRSLVVGRSTGRELN